jgi:hypothetical protein
MKRWLAVLGVGAAATFGLVAVSRSRTALAQPPLDKQQPSKIETATFALG